MITQTLPILQLSIVDLRSANVIAISDLSTYATLPDFANVSLQLTLPNSDTIGVTFYPGQVNIYKCVDLGLTCGDSGCTPLPDGIYSLTYSVFDTTGLLIDSIDQKFIKIDTIKCKYQKQFLNLNIDGYCHNHSQKKYNEELRRIKLYIDGSVSACNGSNYVLSYDLYTKADFLLGNFCCKFKSVGYTNPPGSGYGNVSHFGGCGC